MRDGASKYDVVGNYRIVPALRYSHVYESNRSRSEPDESRLTVLLTISISESLGILAGVVEALPDLLKRFSVISVKPHPDIGVSAMQSLAEGKWKEATHFSWESERLKNLIDRSTVVISAGTSSAVEAICAGVPVVIFGRVAGLDMNPVETFDRRLWRIVYDAQGLREAIADWTPRHPIPFAERVQAGLTIRDSNFERVSDETMRAFIPVVDNVHACG